MSQEEVKIQKYGTREQVFNNQAQMTKGKLTKDDLEYCEKTGKYKSVRAIARGKALISQLKESKSAEQPVQAEPLPPLEAKSSSSNSLDASNKPKRTRKKKVVEEVVEQPIEPAVEVKPKRGRKKKVVSEGE